MGRHVALSLVWTGSMEADVGPGRVQVSTAVRPGGGTNVELPPLGRISAATHAAPLRVQSTVIRVDVDAVQRSASGSDPLAALQADIDDDLESALVQLVRRVLL